MTPRLPSIGSGPSRKMTPVGAQHTVRAKASSDGQLRAPEQPTARGRASFRARHTSKTLAQNPKTGTATLQTKFFGIVCKAILRAQDRCKLLMWIGLKNGG